MAALATGSGSVAFGGVTGKLAARAGLGIVWLALGGVFGWVGGGCFCWVLASGWLLGLAPGK